MKILWLCNIVLPELCEIFGIKKTVFGGWLSGLWGCLIHQEDLEMAICVPIIDKEKQKDGIHNNYRYYSVPISKDVREYVPEQQNKCEEILDDFQPDIIHIWGTEYRHTHTMVKACEKQRMLEKVLVNIQGLISVYALHYCLGLEKYISMLDENNSIQEGQRVFIENGEYEKEVLQKVSHVIGRTEWDRACCLQINKNVTYLQCGEILRDIFYERKDKWNWNACKKHSIFISQASYPVKGFHLIIKEIACLKKVFSDLRVYVAGSNVTEGNSEYGIYLREKIAEEQLEDTVTFIGNLTADEMYEYYLKANVFLSPSTIENSSNSICEAQMVGVPVVSSYVGGISTLIEHGVSGFYYPLNESYMMRHYIESIFENESIARELSKHEMHKAKDFNNKNKIVERMIQIYQDCAAPK